MSKPHNSPISDESAITDQFIDELISLMRQKSERYSREQLFHWETRHLTAEQKQYVEDEVWERWNER